MLNNCTNNFFIQPQWAFQYWQWLKTILIAKPAGSPVNSRYEDKEEKSETVVPEDHKSKIPLPVERGVRIQDHNKCTCIARDTEYFETSTNSQSSHKVDAAESVRKFKLIKIQGDTTL